MNSWKQRLYLRFEFVGENDPVDKADNISISVDDNSDREVAACIKEQLGRFGPEEDRVIDLFPANEIANACQVSRRIRDADHLKPLIFVFLLPFYKPGRFGNTWRAPCRPEI